MKSKQRICNFAYLYRSFADSLFALAAENINIISTWSSYYHTYTNTNTTPPPFVLQLHYTTQSPPLFKGWAGLGALVELNDRIDVLNLYIWIVECYLFVCCVKTWCHSLWTWHVTHLNIYIYNLVTWKTNNIFPISIKSQMD